MFKKLGQVHVYQRVTSTFPEVYKMELLDMQPSVIQQFQESDIVFCIP